MSFIDLKAARSSKFKSYITPTTPSGHTSVQDGPTPSKTDISDVSTKNSAATSVPNMTGDISSGANDTKNTASVSSGIVPIDVELYEEKNQPKVIHPYLSVTDPAAISKLAESKPIMVTSPSSDTIISDYPIALPANLEIRSSANKGRGLWTSKQIVPGDAIISVLPFIHVLSTKCLDFYCSACSTEPAEGEQLKRCTRCRVIRYCNAKCQNRDWNLHKNECTALQQCLKAPSKGKGKEADDGTLQRPLGIPGEAIRCLGRVLWKKKFDASNAETRSFDLLLSQRKTLKPESYESHTSLAHSLMRYLGVTTPSDLATYGVASAADLVDVISRFVTNTFALTSPDLTHLGVAVSPTVALINHSCDPNAALVFPWSLSKESEPCMKVVALKKIQPGEEILTAYIDTTVSRQDRREALEKTYGFLCACTICEGKVGVDPREAIYCPKGCGGLCPYPTEEKGTIKCSKCSSELSDTDAIKDAIRLGCEALEKAKALQFTEPERVHHLVSNMIRLLTSTGFPPSSHPLLSLMRLNQGILIPSFSYATPELLDEMVRTVAKSTAGLSSVLVRGHPVRAVAVAELGKILAMDERPAQDIPSNEEIFPPRGAARLKLACETLVRAKGELTIAFGHAHGGGGKVGKQVREMIRRVERELGVWQNYFSG